MTDKELKVRYIQEPLYNLSWDEVENICKEIALEVDRTFGPGVIVGVGKGGLIPAAIIASLLRIEILPCVVSRKRRGEVVRDKPEMVSPVSSRVSGERVLVVDEMVMTGETMRMVVSHVKKEKARLVRTACIWASVESWKPTYYAIESAGYVTFPWDYEVVFRGKLIPNPIYEEYRESLEMVDKWTR